MRGTPLFLVSLLALLQLGEFFSEKVGGTRVAMWEEWLDCLGRGRGEPCGAAGRPEWVARRVRFGVPDTFLRAAGSPSVVRVFELGSPAQSRR